MKHKQYLLGFWFWLIISLAGATLSFSATLDDIEFTPVVTLENVHGHSVNIEADPSDNYRPHVFWVYDGDIRHSYRRDNGTWSTFEKIPDNGATVFGGDEHGNPTENIGTFIEPDGTIHIAYTILNGRVLHIHGTTGNWSDPEWVNNTTYAKNYLDIAKFGNQFYVVWEDGPLDKLYYVVKTGDTWGDPVFIDNGEYCKLHLSDSGYLYYMSRGAIEPRNVRFGYIAPGGTSWTFVQGATDATGHLGIGPGITSYNGQLYIAFSSKNSGIWNDTWKETSIYCATAPEPGTNWTTRINDEMLIYANTSSPNPRVGVFSDGTVMVYNSRRDNEQIKLWDGVSWSDSLAAPWNDGTSYLAQAGMAIWVAHQSYDNGAITVTGVFNNAPQHLNSPTISSAEKVNGNNIQLTFNEVTGATGYNVYRGTSATFVPDTISHSNRIAANISDESGGLAGVQWTDTDNVAGDPAVNYFYAVTAASTIESSPSNIYGEFDYNLITTATTDYNDIALSLDPGNIDEAYDLLNAIPSCNSVAQWNATAQSYDQYIPIPGFEFTNFTVYAGYSYYVNVTSDAVFTLTGAPSDPTFNLVTTPTSDFNEVMLPLDRGSITTASALQVAISSCNSVARWNASSQSYQQFLDIPGFEYTDFETRVGYPYYVNVTTNVSWPSGGALKAIAPQANVVERERISGVPHVVYARLDKDVAGFRARLEHGNQVLTEAAAGSRLVDGNMVIQLADFTNGWQIGARLHVELLDANGNAIGQARVELTDQPQDQMIDITMDKTQTPASYQLSQNYPNPFNPETLIKYATPQAAHIQLIVYNTMGQRIRTLVDGHMAAGDYQVVWDGRNDAGQNMPSGMYFYMMKSGNFQKQLKAVLIR